MWPLRRQPIIKDRETIRRLSQMTSPYSPDMGLLQEHQRCLIFVFDDMMAGMRNADLIVETSVTGRWPLAHVYTEDKFYFWKKDLGALSYPIALDKPVSGYTEFRHDKEPGKIWGELYAIRPSAFNKLDTERENGVQYTRRRVNVKCYYTHANPIPEIRETILPAWMYVGNHEYWDDQLAGVMSSQPIPKTPDPREWLGAHYRFK
jgi:gamma-glutamylcyclotransferase (GGCT)/AIG2-like uncharacterized protein YtfP